MRIPVGFTCVASPKIMSDCHMLRLNICDAGRHTETRKRDDIYKSAGVACTRATGAG